MSVDNSRFTVEIEKALGYSIGKIKRGRSAKVVVDKIVTALLRDHTIAFHPISGEALLPSTKGLGSTTLYFQRVSVPAPTDFLS